MGRLGHRPALDGVRGIAILLVIGNHFKGLPRHGVYGVDVFFVLSGFLITTLLLEEHMRRGAISLRGFYVRRARRLLPALAVMLVLAALISAASFSSRQMLIVFGSAVFYASNFVRAYSYPDQISGGPTNHLWSLAAEEQFYLVWPLLLILLIRRRVDLVRLLTVAFVALVGYRFALIATGASAARVHFSPDTHAEGLMLGCLLAVAFARGFTIKAVVGWAGLAAVVACAFFSFPHGTTFGLPLVELASAALLAGAIQPGLLARALAVRPLAYLGVISYSLYLWHEFAIWVTLWNHRLIAAVLTVPLTLGSYYLVERPFRRRRAIREKRAHASPSTVLTEA